MTWISVLAVLLSPLVAVLVTRYLQDRREKRAQKLMLFSTLMATRHEIATQDQVRALNMIDVIFHDSQEVRRLWHEYFDMLGNKGLQNKLGLEQWRKKNWEMLTAMAKVVGYGSAITHLDVDRVYYPEALGRQSERSEELASELLRVLKASGGVQFISRESGDATS